MTRLCNILTLYYKEDINLLHFQQTTINNIPVYDLVINVYRNVTAKHDYTLCIEFSIKIRKYSVSEI